MPQLTIDLIQRCRWLIDWEWLISTHSRFVPKARPVAMEIGIGGIEISAIPGMVAAGCLTIGVDPLLRYCQEAEKSGAVIIHAAVTKGGESVRVRDRGGSSSVDGMWCPTNTTAQYVDVLGVTMADIDSGEVDFLNVDCEGSEHIVLAGLKSRPLLLGIELWPQYPHRAFCLAWLADNKYQPILSSGPEGESLLFRRVTT